MKPGDEPPAGAASTAEHNGSAVQAYQSEEHACVPTPVVMHILLTPTNSGLGIVREDMAVWCAYTGQSAEEAQGWGWLEVIHPDDRQRVARAWSQAVATKSLYELEYRLRRSDGVYRSFSVRAVPIRDPDGIVRRWAATCADITGRKELEAELRASEERFRATFEQAAVGIAHMGLDHRWLMVNQRFCDIVGYTREELLARTFQDITHPEDLAANLDSIRAMLAGETSARALEKRYIRKDGSTIWANLTLSLVRDATGAPQYFVSVIEDISERRRVEEERAHLLAGEQAAHAEAMARASQLEAIFEAMTDGIFVYEEQGSIIQANTAGRELLAFASRPNYPTQPLHERVAQLALRDEQGRLLPEEEWPQRRVLRGEVLKGASAVDLLVRALDGRELLLNNSGAPVRDTTGRIIGGVIVLRDVTERRQTERHTHEVLQKLLTVAEALVSIPEATNLATPDAANGVEQRLLELTCSALGCARAGILLIEPETQTLQLAAARGLAPEYEHYLRSRLQESQRDDQVARAIIDRLQTGEAVILDLAQPPLRGRCEGRGQALVTPMQLGNRFMGMLGLSYEEQHDYSAEEIALAQAVTQLVALAIEHVRLLRERAVARVNELALREANRRMDEFLGIATHELKTPLATIKGNIQLLLRRAKRHMSPPGEETLTVTVPSDPLERIQSQVSRLTRLVDDLLDVSRVQTGYLKLRLAPCDLGAIVRNVVEEQRLVYPARTILLDLQEQAAVPVVADADRIGQVVTNYLINGLSYSPVDRPVTVSVQVAEQTARVSVRDEGPGLSITDQARIWERFYRISEQSSGAGLGLGLYISRAIIERHQGQVGVSSAPGAGSTFWFTLPLVREAGG